MARVVMCSLRATIGKHRNDRRCLPYHTLADTFKGANLTSASQGHVRWSGVARARRLRKSRGRACRKGVPRRPNGECGHEGK